jgi:hypothetical protein
MSGLLIIITGVIYFAVACEQAARGNTPMAITYMGYTVGNVGLWMLVK